MRVPRQQRSRRLPAIEMINPKQRNVLVAAAILFTFSELFPPWVYEGPVSSRRSAGYHFLKSPPAVKSPGEMKAMFSVPPNGPLGYIGVKIDPLPCLWSESDNSL